MQKFYETAKRQGCNFARFCMKDKQGLKELFFVKDAQGRVLFNGNSFTWAELQRLFPADGANLQEPTGKK